MICKQLNMPSTSTKVHLFCCKKCDNRLWFAPNQRSECWLCKNLVEASPNTMKKKCSKRQFKCGNANCSRKGCLWWKLVCEIEERIRAKCKYCTQLSDAVPKGKEEGIGACNFKCKCGHQFTVVCEKTDTAPCYKCGKKDVSPYRLTPPRPVKRTTDNTHSCSKCDGKGDCPNIRQLYNMIRAGPP